MLLIIRIVEYLLVYGFTIIVWANKILELSPLHMVQFWWYSNEYTLYIEGCPNAMDKLLINFDTLVSDKFTIFAIYLFVIVQ